MKTSQSISAALFAIFSLPSAQAVTVVPLTGVNIVPGVVISLQTTTAIGNGIPTTGSIIPSGTTNVFLTFSSPITAADATVTFGGFSSTWVASGNTLTTTSSAQAAAVAGSGGWSTTGPTAITVASLGGGLPSGSSIQTVTFIPEPSAAFLGAIGCIAFLRRRRTL